MAVDNSWLPATLGQHVDILTGYPFQSALYTTDKAGIPLLRGDNIVQGRFRWDDVKRWPPSEMEGLSGYLVQSGDVVLAMDRPWIEAGLKYAAVTVHDLPCLLVQRVARLRTRTNLDQGFLRYLIGSAQFTAHIIGVQTGTAVPHISANQIREYRFLLPPLPDQRAIARTLSALDDKIELNRRMSETLEAMARAIFKSWFVDFDPVYAKAEGRQPAGMDTETAALFPDRLDETELGLIPREWQLTKMGSVLSISRAGLNPGSWAGEVFDHYSIPAYDEGRLPKAETGASIKSNKYTVSPDSVLISKLNPHIPRVWLPALLGERRSVCSTEFLVTRPVGAMSRPYLYALLSSPQFLEVFGTLVTGTSGSHQRVQPESLVNLDIVVPNYDLIARFTHLAQPLYERAAHNLQELRTLSAIRDALLPKLLSGEVRVPEAENAVEAAV